MRLRQRYAAIMAAVMIATWVPTFGASTNTISKVVTVAKDATLKGTTAPNVKIELKDSLNKGESFYLHLENAQWVDDVEKQLGKNENFTFTRNSRTQLSIKVNKNIIATSATLEIPLLAKITGGEATVEIESNGTAVTSGKYAFAVSDDTKGKVVVGDIKGFAVTGDLATITIEEPYIGAFRSNQDQFLKFELKGRGIELNHKKGDVLKGVLVGKKAYRGKDFSATVLDKTTLEVKIPKNSLNASQRGEFELAGIQVKALKSAPYGDVQVALRGDLVENTTVTVGKYSDYGTEVTVAKEYKAVAGQKLEDIEFTLAETVPNSLQGNRETVFVFPEGITIDTVVISQSKGIQMGKNAPTVEIMKKNGENTNEFRVSSIISDIDKNISMTFKATLDIPTTFNKDIRLIVSGQSIEEEKQILVAKVQAPVAVAVTPARVKVGLSKQTGGSITLTETKEGNIQKGKIFLAIEESTMRYTKAPKVEVTEGNLRVDDVEIVAGGLELTIKNESTRASKLVISGGEITVDRTVPDGNFFVKVGGPALSDFSSGTLWNRIDEKHNDIDAIIEETFIIVGALDVEQPNKDTNTAKFKIGQATYTINGETKTMDAVPYSSGGRIMLPVRYVADALGIMSSQIVWDGESKTVTIVADKTVQIKLGSKEMIVNNTMVPMSAEPEVSNGRIFVPVAEVARALGAEVAWDGVNKVATFN